MYLDYVQTIALAQEYRSHFADVLTKNTIITCPSFEALASVKQVITQTRIVLGAQDCSAHRTGAYTGQVSAQSLAQLGCTYCIVGHSELRTWQTNHDITQKINHLFEARITPIICISSQTKEQLEPIVQALANQITPIIAYEPLTAIGTGIAAASEVIEKTCNDLIKTLAPYQHRTHYHIVYGGSVNPENASSLKRISLLDGFLIGSASTDVAKMHAIMQAPF